MKDRRLLDLLRFTCICLFLGRAWQHLFWDAPYRALLWDEGLLKPFIERWTSFTWTEWVTSEVLDQWIQGSIQMTGGFYLLCAACCWRVVSGRRLEQVVLMIGSASLAFLSFLFGKEKFYQLGQFLEYALQVGAPLLLVAFVRAGSITKRIDFAIRWMTALTFACHGLYAIGWYPVPGEFVEMTMTLLKVGDQSAIWFLKVVGALDIVIAFTLVANRFVIPSYAYAIFWGLATATARVASNVEMTDLAAGLHQWLPETLLRLPHGLVPAFALAWIIWMQQEETASRAVSQSLVDEVS